VARVAKLIIFLYLPKTKKVEKIMSDTFSNKFIADEKNLALLKETMWGPNGIRQAEELASKVI
jgi:hypothetical protein